MWSVIDKEREGLPVASIGMLIRFTMANARRNVTEMHTNFCVLTTCGTATRLLLHQGAASDLGQVDGA